MNHPANKSDDIGNIFGTTGLLALTVFLGIWIQQPGEVLGSSERNTAQYILFGIEIIGLVLFLLGLIFTRKSVPRYSLVLIGNIIALCGLNAFLLHYIQATGNVWETWIIQLAWYVRLNGIAIGLFMGLLAGAVILQIMWYLGTIQSKNKQDQMLQIGGFIGMLALHLSIMHWIFMPYGFMVVLLYTIIIQFVSTIWSIIKNSSVESTHDASQKLKIVAIERKINLLWFLPFIVVQIIFWIIFLIDEGKEWNVELYLLPILVGVLVITFWSAGNLQHKRYFEFHHEKPLEAQTIRTRIPRNSAMIRDQIGGFILGVADLARIGFIIVYIALPFYLFPTPYYAPAFFSCTFLFGVVGVGIFLIFRQYPALLKIFYLGLVGIMMYLMVQINRDVILNLYSYYDGTIEIILPFQVLLSNFHAATIGIAFGFIFSYEIFRLFTRGVNWGNLPWRAFSIFVVFIVLGVLIGNTAFTGVLGGSIAGTSYTPQENPFTPKIFLEGKYENIFWSWLGIGVAIFILDILIPVIIQLLHRKGWVKTRYEVESQPETSIQSASTPVKILPENVSMMEHPKSHKREAIAVALLVIFLVPIGYVGGNQASVQSAYNLQLMSTQNGVDVFIAPSYLRIAPNQWIRPSSFIPDMNYSLQMARNEYEDLQLVVVPHQRSLNGLRYSINKFQRDGGVENISISNIQVRYVENVIEDQFPDKLIPFSLIHLTEQRNHLLWVTAYVPYNTGAGVYTGIINFTFGNKESFALRLSLNVWNFTIPNMRHFRSNLGPQTADSEHVETFLTHRINSYGIPVSQTWDIADLNRTGSQYTCYLNYTSQQWTFNWSWWDAQTEAMINRGANGFYINCPLGMPRDPWWYEPNSTTKSAWGNETANFYKAARDHLVDLRDNYGKNWLPYVYIYFIDEWQMFVPKPYTSEQYIPLLAGYLDIINSSAPEFRIMTTSPPKPGYEQVRKYIDIYCPVTYDYNKTEWDAAMTEGKEMWMYPCVGPRSPWPNSHLYNRLFEIRVLYWQAYYYGIQGFLYWSTNAYYHGSYGEGYNAWGDGWFVYQDAEGHTYDSMRWENYRNAAEDYEYLWLMNATIAAKGSKTEDLALMSNLVSEVTQDRYNYCDSGDVFIRNRAIIGNWLSEIQNTAQVDVITLGEQQWYPISNR